MRTKAFSTRLQFGEDDEIIKLLDEIEESGADPGEWLRDAAKSRFKTDLLSNSAATNGDMRGFVFHPDPETDMIDQVVQALFDSMSGEEQTAYIRDAIRMRAAIEDNAPAYFVGQWRAHEEQSSPELPNTLSESLEGPSSEAQEANDTGEAPDQEGGYIKPSEDGFDLYRSALPALLRLEMMERA